MIKRFQIGDWVEEIGEFPGLRRILVIEGDDKYRTDFSDRPISDAGLEPTKTANNTVAYPAKGTPERLRAYHETAIDMLREWLETRVGKYETIHPENISFHESEKEMDIPDRPDVQLWHLVQIEYVFPKDA